MLTKSKKKIDVLYSGEIIIIGNEKYIIFGIHDLTVIKNAEIVLQNHQVHLNKLLNEKVGEINNKLEQYKLYFDNANLPIFIFDLDGNIIEFNKKFLSLIEIKKSDAVNLKLRDLFANEYEYRFILKDIQKYNSAVDFKTSFKTKSKKIKPLHISINRILFSNDSFIQAIITEIYPKSKSLIEVYENGSRLNAVEKIMGMGSWEMDIPEQKFKWSSQLLKLFNCENIQAEKPILDFISETIYPDDLETAKSVVEKAISNSESFKIVLRAFPKKNYDKYLLVQGAVFTDENNKPAKLVGTVLDITEQRKQELILSVRTNLWNLPNNLSIKELLTITIDEACKLVESPIGFYHFIDEDQNNILMQGWSTRTQNEFCNAEEASSHYPIEQAGVWADCVRERRTIIHNDYASLTNKKGMPEGHAEVIRELIVPIIKNNVVVAIFGVGNKSTDYDESDAKIVEALADITWNIVVKKRYEANLLKQSKIIENIAAGIIVTDANGKIEFINPAYIQKSGYKEIEILGQNPSLFKSGKHSSEFYSNLWETIKKGNIWRGEMYNRDKYGKCFWEYVIISPILNNNGEIINFVAIKEDITNLKNLNNELIVAKLNAEKSDKLKSEFLTQISHEIRTPINTLLSFSSLIKSEICEHLNDDLSESFNHIDNAGKRIIRTIDLLIKMSELYTDNYEPNFKVNDLFELLEDLIKVYKPLAEKKQIEISFVKLLTEAEIIIDYRTIYDVFQNLLDNAVKYTDQGKITILVKRSIRGNITVSIIDTGIGISSDYIGKIFSPFTQETNGYTRKYDGNGLGLALVKEYCKLNNSEIFVSSEKGKGSDFTVIFK